MPDLVPILDRARQSMLLRLLLAAVAGGLSVLVLPPFSLILFLPIAYATLLLCLLGLSTRAAFLVGWSFGLAQFGFGLSWIAESFYVDAEQFGALAIPAVAGLSAFLAIFTGLAAAVHGRLSRRHAITGLRAALLLATCWTGAEWLRGHILTGFPWNLAGYAFVDYAALRQPAAWVGSYGLSFLAVFAGALPGAALAAPAQARRSAVAVFAALTVSIYALGASRLASPAPEGSGLELRIVQGNIPQREKWAPGRRERSLERYLDLSARPGGFDVLLWPESAFPGFLDEDDDARARISGTLPEGTVLLTGVPDRVATGDGVRYFNTVQAFDSSGNTLTGYAKHHLVPFGEYVPYAEWLPIKRLTEGLGDFTPGPGPRTLALPGIPLFSVAICYEIIFPGGVVDRLFRPDWIFNATNDAWFGTSIGPEQHLASARMRAVEEALPVIRAANTGISAVIDARGEIISRLDTGVTGIIDVRLPGAGETTPYARFGDWMLAAMVAGAWAFLLLAGRLRRVFTRTGRARQQGA